jgi:hypothetical protein
MGWASSPRRQSAAEILVERVAPKRRRLLGRAVDVKPMCPAATQATNSDSAATARTVSATRCYV